MFIVKVKDALERGEAEIQKILGDVAKYAPQAEEIVETVVTVLAPAEANALNTIINGVNNFVATFNKANSDAVAAGGALGASPTLDSQFVTDVKGLVADFEAALKAVHVIK